MKSHISNSPQTSNLKPKHLKEVKSILDHQFGEGYLKLEELSKYINKKECLGLVALKEDEVLGVSFSVLGNSREIAKHLLKENTWFKNEFTKYESVGLRKHLAIKDGYEGLGIGTLLVKESVRILEESCGAVVTIVWEEGNGKAMERLMLKNDLNKIRTILHYWKEDSIVKKYICPECLEIPCGCSATIYVKEKRHSIGISK